MGRPNLIYLVMDDMKNLTTTPILPNINLSFNNSLCGLINSALNSKKERRSAMGKKEIVAKMARDSGVTLHQAQKAFQSLLESVKTSLRKGSKVNLSGFGSFELRIREARRGRNPKTGQTIDVPRRKRIKFNPSRMFKGSL
jgi:DNA-binding protein HU-beta